MLRHKFIYFFLKYPPSFFLSFFHNNHISSHPFLIILILISKAPMCYYSNWRDFRLPAPIRHFMKEQKLFLKMEISISPFQTPKPGNFLNKSFYLIFLLQYFIPNMLRSSSARDPPALAGRLARARLIDSPPGSCSGSAAQVHLLPLFFSKLTKKNFPFSRTPSSPAATIGRAAAPFVLSSPSPLPAMSASSMYARPFSSFCCARQSTPNPNKTICIRIWIQLQYITY